MNKRFLIFDFCMLVILISCGVVLVTEMMFDNEMYQLISRLSLSALMALIIEMRFNMFGDIVYYYRKDNSDGN